MDKNQKFFVLFGIFVIIVVVLLVFYYFAIRDDKEFTVRDEDSFTSQQDYLNYLEEYKQAMSKDIYGGKTPEETLQLFVDALKKGDTELASKYFVLDKQKKTAEELSVGKQNDILRLLIADLEKEKEKIQISEILYRFRTYDKDGIAEFSFDLILNESTNLWKIESL